MERGWERRHPFLELSAGEIERLVSRALPGLRVVSAAPLTSGLRNTNYRLELAGDTAAVLRLYAADPEACGREAAVLAAIRGLAPVPRVRYFDATAAPPFALLDWLSGVPMHEILDDTDDATTLALAAVCGAALAGVHSIRFSVAGFLGPDMDVVRPMPAWAPVALDTLAGPVENRLGSDLAARLRETVESSADCVAAVWSDAVLVHADYKPWNLLVQRADPGSATEPWRLTGILDWEFACAGCKLIDFATFLRGEADRPPGFADAFATAYLAAGGSLPAEWRRLSRLIDLLNLLQLLEEPDPRRAEDLRRLVAGTLAAV